MAWIYERKWVAIRYTPFDFENEQHPSDDEYIEFRSGLALEPPLSTMACARQKKQTSGAVPDILTIRIYNFCNRRFKDFVERWEPGLHFFRPFSLLRKNGEPIGEYYAWSVGQDVDCILTDNLGPFWEAKYREFQFNAARTKAQYQHRLRKPGDEPLIRISKQTTHGRHLWTAGFLAAVGRGNTSYFLSDEFHAAYKKEKFTGLELIAPATELDVPWVAKDNMGLLYDDWRAREVNIRNHWPDAQRRHGGEVIS